MCGFVGYVEDGEKDRKIIKSMSDTIKHRGPDDEGFCEFCWFPMQGRVSNG